MAAISPETLKTLLRPIVRLLLRYGVSYKDFCQAAKSVFVNAAADQLEEEEYSVNVSRLSVMTGVHRADVKRIFEDGLEPIQKKTHLVSRIISTWELDPDFTNSRKAPKALTFEGEESEFSALVKKITTSVPPGTVLYELQRLGSVEVVKNRLRLLQDFQFMGESKEEGFWLLAEDLRSLSDAASENIEVKNTIPNLHIRTEYDNIDPSSLETIRIWLVEHGRVFHREARAFLSQYDRDVNPDSEFDPNASPGAKVVVSAFSHLE